ncbi:MAG: hypothetical protein M1826_001693 [Phylliscum demangeonii]|nr:MAG: hypothetical protein M1826_001693 [Phylliscum demangeonii]
MTRPLPRPRLPNLLLSGPAPPSPSAATLLPDHASSSSSSLLPPPSLLHRISTHPALRFQQVRNGTRNTFNPSHRVRKRRHGFLARLRTRTGRMILKRRRARRRASLSH